MERVVWSPEFELGISEIDEQHKKLVQILNDVIDVRVSGSGSQKMEAIIESLVDYTDYHFKAEENYMGQAGYTGLTKHRREHDGFSDRLRIFYLNTSVGEVERIDDILGFLKKWLLHHILQADRDYVGAVLASGIR